MAESRRHAHRYRRTSTGSIEGTGTSKDMGKPRPDVSPGGSKDSPEKRKVRPKRERWLLTRKTWRYMADAGRRLIPEGLQNRPEDVPKIEAYFQEVCHKEPRFLLWRKQSYPGALGFRNRGRSRGGRKKIGGSVRDKTSSADEAEDIKKGSGRTTPQQPRKLGSRLDLKKLKEDFLLGSFNRPQPQSTVSSPEEESDMLLETLEKYLKEKPADPKGPSTSKSALDHEELLSKLREYLDSIEKVAAEERARPSRPTSVHFEGDHMQKMLLETIRRHFGKSTNREKVISDMLTDRKSLEKLYFDLRKTRGFKSGQRGGDSVGSCYGAYSASRLRPLWRPSDSGSGSLHYQDLREEEGSDDEEGSTDSRQNTSSNPASPPPVIEVEPEEEPSEKSYATQTDPVPGSTLVAIQDELKRIKLKQELEEQEQQKEETQKAGRTFQRRSSVTDNDDVSPSVGDTIKRYLRMARKKSIDSDKADRFKRVNYDKNIRNIKPKGEITLIGDDDGLDKGIQTDESWVVALKELKLEDRPGEMSPLAEDLSSSRMTSSRSSVDTGVEDLSSPPQTPQPPMKSPSGILSSGQTFLSNLLHHQKTRNAPSSSVSAVPGAMQKSRSTSSVVHQGSLLVAKKIWKGRSKSQTRVAPSSAWTPQGSCQWSNVTGRTIALTETNLLQLSDIERRVLQKVALAKLQALNLGVAVRIPSELVAATTVQKPKRRAYLLKRKAITTGFFDSKSSKDDKEKGDGGGMVFGIPLGQCVQNERLARSGKAEEAELRRKAHHGSRSSCTSLVDEKGSSESLLCPAVSMPGLLDSLSVGSGLDLNLSQEPGPGSGGVPNIVSSCLRHLESYGLHTLGIFRVSSSKKRVRQLREDFDCGKDFTMEPELCPHDVATLLKEYFRDLPDSLLCKDLYAAFIQTQRIRNRRLQHEALQHLLQLLPVPNRDTLWSLLSFLNQVARNSDDRKDSSGEWVVGNKMDSNNLATLFAPNILHSCKTTSTKDELSAERTEERSDAINVIRALIDNYRSLYQVSAELLDEVYVHMMDSHPEALDQLLQRRDLATEETEDLDVDVSVVSEERSSTSTSAVAVERKMWSREAFTHETAGMGGPDLEMKPRKERGRERVIKKRWREEQTTSSRQRVNSEKSTPSRRTSSTSQPDETLSPDDPMNFRGKTSADSGVITASLKIPVPSSAAFTLNDSDIPFIEDSERHQMTFGIVRSTQRISSESSQEYVHQRHDATQQDSAVGSSVSPPRSSLSSGGVFSSPPSWASSPPTSPDHTQTTVNYLPDEPSATTARITFPTSKGPDPQQRVTIQRVTIKSAGEVQQVKQTYSQQEPSGAQERRRSRDSSAYQQVSTSELTKSSSSAAVAERRTDRSVTPSISSIGGAVMRSKTADIERMLKIQTTTTTTTSTKQSKKTTGVSSVGSEEEKKIKRKYTDSRHVSRTLPQMTETVTETEVSSSSRTTEQRRSGVVYKRRELISSEPKERRGFLN